MTTIFLLSIILVRFIWSALFLRWRDVFLGHRRTFSEEELVQLFDDDFLIFAAGRVQAVFVEQHLAVFGPQAPRFLGYVVVDFAAEVVVKGRLVEPRQFPF